MKRFRFVRVAALAACLLGARTAPASVTTDDLGPAPDSKQITYVAMSPDCHNIAMVVMAGTGVELRVNGKSQATADDILFVLYSPDSARLAYTARKDKTWYVILDGKETSTGSLQASQLVFSDDGRHLGYVTKTATGDSAIVDGRTIGANRQVVHLTLSGDGSHVAYGYLNDQKQWAVMRDGKDTGHAYPKGVDRIRFSPDGQHLVLVGCLSDDLLVGLRYEVVVDNDTYGPYYEILSGPVFFQKGAHWAFAADRSTGITSVLGQGAPGVRSLQVVDGKEDSTLPRIAHRNPDSVGTGLEQSLYSDDGAHHLLVESEQVEMIHEKHLFIDGQEREGFPLKDVTMSPDGKRLASEGYRFLVIDGQRKDTDFELGPLLFSPDSQHLAYAVAKPLSNDWFMDVDDILQPAAIVLPTVDVRWNPPQWDLLYDHVEDQASFDNGHSYNGQYPYHFDPDGTLVYFRVTDGHLYRVHWKPDDATTAPATRP